MKRKVLLMGRSASGKTSMRSIIFANYLARDTMRLGPTLGVENSNVRFLGNLVLNLWDCGGQDLFMEQYFQSQKDQIFRNVEVLIFVVDIESAEPTKDLEVFRNCVEALQQHSKNAHVFCLIHKMDLIREPEQRVQVFEDKSDELAGLAAPTAIKCFATSIWDETLYKAWSQIVYSLVPNVDIMEATLSKFCGVCEADEVVLFEKATFLNISTAYTKEFPDNHRFEKISNIIKQFKLSCSKSQANFQSMQVQSKNFTAFIYAFTSNTYVMVIMSNPDIQPAATLMNIDAGREVFEKIVSRYVTQ